ncbi:hypothetical protein CJD36_008210 [Flavipsychrobacter stenotrophus]|uniref:Uncharacterized protein n=1 Tax=Flavipsychrobacter stenotrophus TaxID=2077091 RepID=A0A2S7SYK0_9BACT|nr:hypothetical protein [Flavipsychrobacter stenotrophus]PQJ11768.1 hypothetical protein CJD36_008210 [Flavipsychrobacter stenotrophus]
MIDFTNTSKGGEISRFVPDSAICLNAVDTDGNVRQLVLLHSSADMWLNSRSASYSDEELGARLSRMVYEDNSLTMYNRESYKLENGIFRLMHRTVPMIKGREREIEKNL